MGAARTREPRGAAPNQCLVHPELIRGVALRQKVREGTTSRRLGPEQQGVNNQPTCVQPHGGKLNYHGGNLMYHRGNLKHHHVKPP